MKVAKWEASTGALAAFLGSRPAAAFKADLYTIAPLGSINGGNALLYTTADVDVLVPYGSGALTYSSKTIYFDNKGQRAVGHQKIGLDVDTWQVQLTPSLPNGSYAGATIGSVPFLQAASAGLLSGATVTVDRAIWDIRTQGIPSGNPIVPNIGVFTRFFGTVAEVDIGRSQLVLSINDQRDQLSLQMPRNVYGGKCRWTLFGDGCNLKASTFQLTGTVTGSASNVLSATIATPSGSGTFALGRIVMTSGKNKGLSRSVRAWTQGSPANLILIAPFPFAISSGDTFNAFPGCDHTFGSCSRFANTSNFGGQPFIPAPEVVA